MAKLRIKYTMVIEEDIDWPDDEIENLTYDNLLINLDVDKAHDVQYEDIASITKDDKEFNF